MIQNLRIENYKALRDVTIELTPIHVLIGPNDSGKTSILEAISALCRSVEFSLPQAFTGSWNGRSLVWHGVADPVVRLSAGGGVPNWEYQIACRFGNQNRQVVLVDESIILNDRSFSGPAKHGETTGIYRACVQLQNFPDGFSAVAPKIREQLTGAQHYRWIPRLLSLPVAPDSSRRFRMEPTGFGLALCLDDILGFDRDRFARLESQFKDLFPHVQSIKLIAEPAFKTASNDPEQIPSLQRAEGKGLHFQYVDGPLVPASQVSDGVLLLLAYLAILHLPEPPRVLLIEEPENGIHPGRLKDVLTMLRTLVQQQDRTQVILTTHSPYVVDLFQPEEVTLTRMQEDGSIAVRRLSDSELVRQQSDVFTLGEIWTAEGDEALSRSEPPVPAGAAAK